MKREMKQEEMRAPLAHPSRLTEKERTALANEARRLAMEFLGGSAPTLNDTSYCGCACAEIVKRTFGVTKIRELDLGPADPWWEFVREVDRMLPDDETEQRGEEGLVSAALHIANGEKRDHGAMVFPLLALADAIEDAPQAPEKIP